MFLMNTNGVPSIASIVRVRAATAPAGVHALTIVAESRELTLAPHAIARRGAVLESAKGRAITVGITGTCPYGIGACWGGAYEALGALEASIK